MRMCGSNGARSCANLSFRAWLRFVGFEGGARFDAIEHGELVGAEPQPPAPEKSLLGEDLLDVAAVEPVQQPRLGLRLHREAHHEKVSGFLHFASSSG